MTEAINGSTLFCDYFAQWVSVYKTGAIRDVTMRKYELTQSWLRKLVPALKLCDLDRIEYQRLINGYAAEHERQTTMDFHHQIKGAVLKIKYRNALREAIYELADDLVME